MCTPFTLTLAISAGAVGILNATITLERSTDNATWSNVKTNQTDAAGGYQFSNNVSAAGTYHYRTAYDGSDTYANAMSNVVSPPTRCASVVESRSSAPAAPC